MAIFKRKMNKNAVNLPEYIRDYVASTIYNTSINGTAFACIDKIASEFASLNFAIYNASDHAKVKRHFLYSVLKEPNLEERHFNFFYQSAVDYYNGGCYWLIIRNPDKEVVSLFRLNPQEVKRTRDENNKIVYNYNGKVYASDDVVYIPSRFCYSTRNGGKSIFDAVSSVFSTADNLEAFTQNTFLNGTIGKRWMLDISRAFPDATPNQIKELKDNFQAEYSGIKNVGRPIIKIPGVEYDQKEGTVTDNRAAELFENRKFQEHEISKIFGMPEEMLNVTSGANIENAFIMFNEFALRPMATQFQDAINSLLDENKYFFEFDYNGVMKVSLTQRIEAYNKQFMMGELSLNEIRSRENLDPIEAGDTHFVPVNMMPLNDETVEAYMAKQKNEIKSGGENPTDPDAQHFGGGDDKQ